MSKIMLAKPNIVYYTPEKTLTAYEEGKIIFKDGDNELKLEVCGRLGNGFNIILHD